MRSFLLLVFVGFLSAGNLIEVIDELEVKSISGDVKLYVEDRNDLYLEGQYEEVRSGKRVSISTKSEELFIKVPPIKHIKIESVSGDLKLRIKGAPNYPEEFHLKTISGDIYIKGYPPSSISLATISGDINLIVDEPLTASIEKYRGRSVDITSLSGSVKIEGTLFSPLYVETYSGDIDVFLYEDVPPELDTITYTLKTKSGDISVYKDERKVKSNVVDGIRLEESRGFSSHRSKILIGIEESRLDWYSILPENGIGYNRVDGLYLGFRSVYGTRSGDTALVGVIYPFKRKRWELFAAVEKKIFDKPISPYLGLSIFRSTATFERWKVRDSENSLASFLFHEDYRDYFEAEGINAGIGLKWPSGKVFLGYEDVNTNILEKLTDWSLFRKDKVFPQNRAVCCSGYKGEFVHMQSSVSPVSFYLKYENCELKDRGGKMRRLFSVVKFKKKYGKNSVLIRAVSGYSPDSLDFPFDFTLGGIGTLPGYPRNYMRGTKKMYLINADYSFEIRSLKLYLFFDAGKVDDGGFKRDVGAGIGLSELSLRAVKPLDMEDGGIKFIVRIEERF